MNLSLWIVASVLAAVFAGSGLLKLLVSKDKLVQSGQGWAQDFSPISIRLMGVAEVLGAVGVILPAVEHIGPVLVPLAAIGLGLFMAGAAVVNVRRKDVALIGFNLVLLALAIFVAWGRLGPYAFTA
jgi:DoxX-like protein